MKRVFIAALALAAGCRRIDEREFAIAVPAMTAADTNAIVQVLKGQCGVRGETVRADLDRKTVSLVYDSMLTARKNLEFALAGEGYEANGVTPESVGAARK